MLLNFENVKQIKQYTKDIVFGYIRIHEKEFKLKQNIPGLIIFACLLFYHEKHHFDKFGKCMKLSDDKKTVMMTADNPYWSNCYSSHWITTEINKITIIRLKINYISFYKWSVSIGLTKQDEILGGASDVRFGCAGSTKGDAKQFDSNNIIKMMISIKDVKYFVNDQFHLSKIFNDCCIFNE